MSARDELINILYEDHYGEWSSPGERENNADYILTKHAHELAEKIQTLANSWPEEPAHIQELLKQGAYFAAEDIDPEAAE